MPTVFAVYNLKRDQRPEEYDNYLTKTKIPGIRGGTLVHRVQNLEGRQGSWPRCF